MYLKFIYIYYKYEILPLLLLPLLFKIWCWRADMFSFNASSCAIRHLVSYSSFPTASVHVVCRQVKKLKVKIGNFLSFFRI